MVISLDDFPKMLSSQVALLRCNYNTGHVLNCNLEKSTNLEYTIFDSLDDAVIYINAFEQKYKFLIEFNVYDCCNNCIYSYPPDEYTHIAWGERQAIRANDSWWRKCLEYIKKKG